MIELHGAHGYLINQFLSTLANERKDEYGGSLENRYLFAKEIIKQIRGSLKGSLWIRLSLTASIASMFPQEGFLIRNRTSLSVQNIKFLTPLR